MLNFDNIIDRKGTFCTQWDFVQDRFGVADLLPFTISDTDFALPQEVLEALTQRLKHPVFGYTRWNHPAFKSSVCLWYQKRFDTQLNEDWLVYSPSVIYSISKLIQLVTKKNEGVIIQTPAYDAFFKVIESNNRQVVENLLCYQENRYTIDFQDLEEKLAQKNNTILLLCSPHNPTGRVWSAQELRKIVALCEQYQVFLISDEIHMDILRKEAIHQPILNFSNQKIALVSSGSKTFNFPGLVFSYAILPDEQLRAQFQLALKNQDGLSSASILGMLATMTAYNACEYWVDELNNYLDESIAIVTDFLQQNIPEIKIVPTEATYLMWLDISELGVEITELQRVLIDIGKVAIMDGSVYGGNGQSFLRLNIGCPKEKIYDGLERVKKSIQYLKQTTR